jgi:hypothetical protein
VLGGFQESVAKPEWAEDGWREIRRANTKKIKRTFSLFMLTPVLNFVEIAGFNFL